MSQRNQILHKAFVACEKLLNQDTEFLPLKSVHAQLKYLIDVDEGREANRSRLNDIVIGVYAAREFESRDMSFAELLYQVEEIVDDMKTV